MLPAQESARVSEHLKQCESCAKEYDEVRFGAALASRLGRASAPEDAPNAIMFLCSEASAHITGTTIHVNGGTFMP